MNTVKRKKTVKRENSKTREPHRFVLKLPQKLDLRSSNKHVAFQNLSIVRGIS